MSYILDALRKSEHERQVAAGQSVGMLYPIEIKRDRKLWIPIGIVVLVTVMTSALIWWLWSKLIYTKSSSAAAKPTTVMVTQPPTTSQEIIPEPEHNVKKLTPEIAQKTVHNPSTANAQLKPSAQIEAKNSTATTIAQVTNVDPLKDLPVLSITGYIHNEQSGSFAMINNQLVREGEEIAPGLRLVKIFDNSAIFSYKGYVFSR